MWVSNVSNILILLLDQLVIVNTSELYRGTLYRVYRCLYMWQSHIRIINNYYPGEFPRVG